MYIPKDDKLNAQFFLIVYVSSFGCWVSAAMATTSNTRSAAKSETFQSSRVDNGA